MKSVYYSSEICFCNNERIKKNNMLSYLKTFDPIKLKYDILPDRIFDKTNYSSTVIKDDIINRIQQYENSFQYGSITKQPYSSIKDNLMLVYGDAKLVKDDIKIFHYTEKKIIHKYIAIPQLDKMFDEDYFNFEWDMHIGQNFAEHRNDYQRDHFIHQIRDMYTMMVLLGNHNFYEATYSIMSDPKSSKISQYTYKKMNQFLEEKCSSYNFLKELNIDISKISTTQDVFWDKCGNLLKDENGEWFSDAYAKNYFLKYVIYGSTILSALFHDMGYPICHFLSVRNRTSCYNPTMYMFTNNAFESFDHIASLLSSSLLFTVVLPEDIKKSLEPDGNRYNHGAYSAIAFLLQFYNSGIIFSLPIEKQCAIELAAIAIYDHTQNYNIEKYDLKNNFYQPMFRQNPVAFLLRLSDDLQEWDRRYFEISTESDIPICSKCLTPSIANRKEKEIEYNCACSQNPENTKKCNSFRLENFKNRKLYLVTTSDYMTSTISNNTLCFHINYDYYKLLNITRINPTYAKYRLKELNKLKTLVKCQNFSKQSNNILGFDKIYFDYFITSNPITIKVKIIHEYLKLTGLLNDSTELNDSNLLNSITDKLKFNKESCLYKILQNNVFSFYITILNYIITETIPPLDLETIANKIINKFFNSDKTSKYYRSIMYELILDCLNQYKKQFKANDVLKEYINSNNYFEQYVPTRDDYFYNCVASYCNTENYFNSYSNFTNDYSNPYIGYFADLYFFELMNVEVQRHYLQKL